VPDETFIVIDGYHGFMARPTDLSKVDDRVFYVGGGYKYAMAGEGVCFLHCPPGYGLRPRDTGWFAEFGTLASAQGKTVGYPADGAAAGYFRVCEAMVRAFVVGIVVARVTDTFEVPF